MRPLHALGLLAAALLLLGLSARAIAPREVTDPEAARATTLLLPPPVPEPRHVTAALPRHKPVRARAGDIVTLTVDPGGPADVLEVGDLGHEAHIGPGVENRLTFVPDRAGRFPVRSGNTGRRLGVLVIRPAGGG